MHITHLCTSVGVTDAPPNGVVALLSTSVSDFLSDGVGEKIGRTEEKYVQIMLPMGAVSTTACSGRQFIAHGSNFNIGATVAA